MVNLDIAKILNKKNVLNLIDGQISLIRKNRYCAWSGEKSFKDKIDKKLLDGKSGLYTLSYQKTLLDLPKLVYLGQSNSIGGRGHHGGYGLYDRLRKKRADLERPHTLILKECCIKKAQYLGYKFDLDLWSYRFWILPQHLVKAMESVMLEELKKKGYCELNSDRAC